MEKIRFNYTGLGNNHPAFCNLTLKRYFNHGSDRWHGVAVFHEVFGNTGMSVTNASEKIAQMVKEQYFPEIDPENVRFFEHYEYGMTVEDNWDEIFYKIENGVYCHPFWQPPSEKIIQNLLGA